ncbi:iron-sulfur cluster-binding protein [Nitriliruptoraceae bacterium ZYF776]|nr:iron-sulfur cluster-binding protein [Profundirhabdus halotolerans]
MGTTSLPIYTTPLRERTAAPTGDVRLQDALAHATDQFADRKAGAYAQFDDVEAVRASARAAKAAVLAELPELLGQLADRLAERGVVVHWADDAAQAAEQVRRIAEETGSRRIVKSKSMLSEEIDLNTVLEADGCQVTETDLGEWIIQLAGEHPSHIIIPAIHKDRGQIRDTLQKVAEGDLSDVPEELAAFAREQLRQRFLEADLGISGANFGVASTGSITLVTNEGNGRMVTSVPRVHVALLGMERIVADWDQLDTMIALLPRAATGQPITTYVSTLTGPRRDGEADGPDEVHVVIVDNGRSTLLGTEYQEMLACIRCGACLNACPVYRQTGGHAYGWVYPGPMGAVLTPLLLESGEGDDLPNASTLCGACWEACPVGIPLQDMLLALRREASEDASLAERTAWAGWAQAWSRPWSYRASLRLASMGSRMLDPGALPGPPQRWTDGRELPEVSRRSFRDTWRGRPR